MDLPTQGRMVAELSKLAEEFDMTVGALLQATQRGLVVGNLSEVLDEFEARLHQVGYGTS